MELSHPDHDATLSLEDLQVIAEIGLLRNPIREAETKRAALVRTIVVAQSELAHALASHTRCMLVNGQGTPGIGNLAQETEQLHAAFARYAELVRSAASDRRRFVDNTIGRIGVDGEGVTRELVGASTSPKVARRKAV
jgi:hypothetical protein